MKARRVFDRPFNPVDGWQMSIAFRREWRHASSMRHKDKPMRRARRVYWPNRTGSTYKVLTWAFRGPWKDGFGDIE